MSESAQDLITLTGGGRSRIGSLPWTGSSTTSRHHHCSGWIKFPLASFSFAGQKPQLSSAHLWGLFLINISHVLKSTIFSDRKLRGEPEEGGRQDTLRNELSCTELHLMYIYFPSLHGRLTLLSFLFRSWHPRPICNFNFLALRKTQGRGMQLFLRYFGTHFTLPALPEDMDAA